MQLNGIHGMIRRDVVDASVTCHHGIGTYFVHDRVILAFRPGPPGLHTQCAIMPDWGHPRRDTLRIE